jgi:hypothetical protein
MSALPPMATAKAKLNRLCHPRYGGGGGGGPGGGAGGLGTPPFFSLALIQTVHGIRTSRL